MKFYLILALVLFINSLNFSQDLIDYKTLRSDFATKARQDKDYKDVIELTRKVFSQKLSNSNIAEWDNALTKAQFYYVDDSLVAIAIDEVLINHTIIPVSTIMTAIEVGKTLFPDKNIEDVRTVLETTNNIYLFAYAANYTQNFSRENILELIKNKFSSYKNHPVYKCLINQFQIPDEEKFASMPPIKNLLEHSFMEGKTIIYSFYRNNRAYPGLTIVKKPNGEFVKNSDGTIFSIPQFSMSYADLPGYLRNGNTPEGIFSIVGSYVSPTESIGPSTNVLTRISFEKPPHIFFHGQNKSTSWNDYEYRDLLPVDWQNYFPAYEAFYAGKGGRKIIVMHGSTDDLRFFKKKPYFPHTPTKGCISAIEFWDPETGICTRSDQTDLINAFFSTGTDKGFLVIVELDDEQSPVRIEDILKYLVE